MNRLGSASGLVIALIVVLAMELAAYFNGSNAFELLIAGLTLGSLYAVIALGYTMVYGIIELINFAHGDVFAVGAFVSLSVFQGLSSTMANFGFTDGQNSITILGLKVTADSVVVTIISIGIAMMVAAVLCGVLGVVIERVAYRPLRNAPKLAPLITAIGVSYIIENLIQQAKGGVILNYPSVMPLRFFNWFGADVRNTQLVVIASAIVLMLVLDRFVNQTKLGKAMRAVAQDREAALMMGINVDRIIATTFFVGSFLAGAGSVIYGIFLASVGYNMGFTLGLFAFTAAVLGGIGNIRGAMLGGLLIGMVQRYVDTLDYGAGTEWDVAVVFGVLVLVLVFRPSGLLGSQVPEKV